MRVIDFISVCDENIEVKLIDEEGTTVSQYNGRDSIDLKYNNTMVYNVSCCDNCIYLYI